MVQGLGFQKDTRKGLGLRASVPVGPRQVQPQDVLPLSAVERIWHMYDSQGRIHDRANKARKRQSRPGSLSSTYGTYKTFKARFWAWLSRQSP